MDLFLWLPYGYKTDHIPSIPGTTYQLPHEFHIFYLTQGGNGKGWWYGAPTNLTITKKFKKQWRGNIILVGTEAWNRNCIVVHIKKGDLTDVVVGMYVQTVLKFTKGLVTDWTHVSGGWNNSSTRTRTWGLEAIFSNERCSTFHVKYKQLYSLRMIWDLVILKVRTSVVFRCCSKRQPCD
jgi:hypothetical protein